MSESRPSTHAVSAWEVEFRFSLIVLRAREDVLSAPELKICTDASISASPVRIPALQARLAGTGLNQHSAAVSADRIGIDGRLGRGNF